VDLLYILLTTLIFSIVARDMRYVALRSV